jgi:IclR helix-turn-helix domain
VAGNCVADGRSVVSKVSAVMGAFAFDRKLTITDIARWTGLPLSTVHRLVHDWWLRESCDWGTMHSTL